MPVAAVCVAVHTGWAFRPKRGDGHWGSRWARGKACRASTGPQKHGAERRSGRCAWRFPGDTPEFEFRQGGEFQNFRHFNLLWRIRLKRVSKFHSATKSRQISTIARRNFVETTRRDSPWRPATVAQVRSSIPSRNPEISTHIRAPPASRFLSKWRCLAGP